MKILNSILILLFPFLTSHAQHFKFAHVTDTHIGSKTGAEDLRRTIKDINQNNEIQFIIISGDITEFGSDEELTLAKQILDSLHNPYYLVPGNHDTNWSESGGNSFRKIFGDETFYFIHDGYRFAGTNSGPNMRMGPGQIPRENLVWMDSILAIDPELPLIYVNHYPQDSSLNNWYESIDRLKKHDIRLMLCGHGHINESYDFEGIPGVMGRSNLRAEQETGGYNIVTISSEEATCQERTPDSITHKPWHSVKLHNHHFDQSPNGYPRPDYSINRKYSAVKQAWIFEDKSDVGAGMAYAKNKIVSGNTNGEVYAINAKSGKKLWQFKTKGKIYSTPAVWKNTVVVGSSDNYIYGIDLKSGSLKWKIETQKAVLGSPSIEKGIAYIGGSDGTFRAIRVTDGDVLWTFEGLKGYLSAKPTVYNNIVYFGTWGNEFYALDISTGEKKWEWHNGATSRMLSPAACYPVATNGRIFIVAPDRYMTALDAENGELIWRKQLDDYRVRESIGLSTDSLLIYAKTMDGQLIGISTTAPDMEIAWQSTLRLPYELAPTAIVESNNNILVPSHSGLLSAVGRQSGKVIWQYKISNCLINPLLPIKRNKLVVSTMDGKIVSLKY
ncbi:PQQ-binding-like beta-propeller repeat protein [Olivibacter sp. SDN3]|uniref:outer membrane protein assembly factor BamB family protein n=1 Tax=Olivibacter sp. SDN3 TaxID=2764720 RepID=UPI001651314E|nr:PQQ-binding-like beta-propeller repeat protein [Olivibacter sp. SDN3]QNL48500.1 PQQ-binding-like beta-propeller repeat protein [Olivibacter sp. SDN3]